MACANKSIAPAVAAEITHPATLSNRAVEAGGMRHPAPSRCNVRSRIGWEGIMGISPPTASDMNAHSSSPFVRTLVREDQRLMIQSICQKCGEMRILSHSDGSLDQWEEQHECDADERSIRLSPAS